MVLMITKTFVPPTITNHIKHPRLGSTFAWRLSQTLYYTTTRLVYERISPLSKSINMKGSTINRYSPVTCKQQRMVALSITDPQSLLTEGISREQQPRVTSTKVIEPKSTIAWYILIMNFTQTIKSIIKAKRLYTYLALILKHSNQSKTCTSDNQSTHTQSWDV